ncbi:MAG: GntR family transcriptional regulator [Ilumatobacter sp.]|uniref:GntR family transcriptional regulator n=1 Tax=Ilumatobacter sp. TaxID=1967498 RepID=UPI003C72630F
MLIEIDLADGAPLYVQIAAGIRRMLAIGELAPGDSLPTGREMAAALDVNLETVQRAYRIVADEGLVVSRVGRGTRVADDVDPRRLDLGSRIDELVRLAADVGVSPAQLAKMIVSTGA